MIFKIIAFVAAAVPIFLFIRSIFFRRPTRIVKNRALPPKAWRWEIYRAGNAKAILDLFRHHGGGQAGGKRCPQGTVEQTLQLIARHR
jgi:hypothetical protein